MQRHLFSPAMIKPPMIDVSAALMGRVPALQRCPMLVRRAISWGLKTLVNEGRINRFLQVHNGCTSFDFIEQVFTELSLENKVHSFGKAYIPATGRVLIVANHPLGGLDGLALLRLIGGLRRDVFIVVNELLMYINPLRDVFIPVDVFSNGTGKADLTQIFNALNADAAVIMFPAGEVSRLGTNGIADGKWLSGFVKIAEKTAAPILPVHIEASNSSLFYLVGRLSGVISMLMLPREMTGFKGRINLRIGPLVKHETIGNAALGYVEKAQEMRRHIGIIGATKQPFSAKTSIINRGDHCLIKAELARAEKLGKTADNMQILLLDHAGNPAVMNEIGRLRETVFRLVGEGTGQPEDSDQFDRYYRHLLLWDGGTTEIAGAYRLGEIWRWPAHPVHWLYSNNLFEYSPAMDSYLAQGLELGRSFIQPQYRGKRSLDYLWQGIGIYLARHRGVRYMFGPVSLSNSLPPHARDMIVHFYTTHFPDPDRLARPRISYAMDPAIAADLVGNMQGMDFHRDQVWLREQLALMGLKIPTLFKQYADVCESGGTRFCGFSLDPAFNHCLDGLVLVDIDRLKPQKRRRYLKNSI